MLILTQFTEILRSQNLPYMQGNFLMFFLSVTMSCFNSRTRSQAPDAPTSSSTAPRNSRFRMDANSAFHAVQTANTGNQRLSPTRQEMLRVESYQSRFQPARNVYMDSQHSIDQSVITQHSSTRHAHLESDGGGMLGLICWILQLHSTHNKVIYNILNTLQQVVNQS